jgi:hypothetical protein
MEQPMKRLHRKRPNGDAHQSFVGEPNVEPMGLRGRPAGCEKKDRLIDEPPQRKADCVRRGTVQPLDVVDREDERSARGGVSDERKRCRAHGARAHGRRAGRSPEERNFQCMALWCWKIYAELICQWRNEISESRIGELRLGFGWLGYEPSEPGRARVLHAGVPQRGLPDPGLPLEHDGDGRWPRERLVNRLQLGLTADELFHRVRS